MLSGAGVEENTVKGHAVERLVSAVLEEEEPHVLYAVPEGEHLLRNAYYTVHVDPRYSDRESRWNTKREHWADHLRKEAEEKTANYVLVHEPTAENYPERATFFRVISDHEVTVLQETYHGDPPLLLQQASDIIGVDLSIDYRELIRDPDRFYEMVTETEQAEQKAFLQNVEEAFAGASPAITWSLVEGGENTAAVDDIATAEQTRLAEYLDATDTYNGEVITIRDGSQLRVRKHLPLSISL